MAATAAYLEQYLDSLESLPAELKRNFNLLRDLDTRAHEEMRSIDKMSVDYLHNVYDLSADEKADSVSKIRQKYKKAMDYGDDKVQLAMQTYEMVDKHIRRLDADLARFEAELKDKALNLQTVEPDSVQKRRGRKSGDKHEKKKGRRGTAVEEEETQKAINKKIKAQTAQPETLPSALTSITHPSDVLDMPVDPNEPTYCFCHQVSYGEMIGCDNPDCPIEWFHFACVGLTSKPKGKWYCSNCSAERKKK